MPEFTNRDLDWARAKLRAITHDEMFFMELVRMGRARLLGDRASRRLLDDLNKKNQTPHKQPKKK